MLAHFIDTTTKVPPPPLYSAANLKRLTVCSGRELSPSAAAQKRRIILMSLEGGKRRGLADHTLTLFGRGKGKNRITRAHPSLGSHGPVFIVPLLKQKDLTAAHAQKCWAYSARLKSESVWQIYFWNALKIISKRRCCCSLRLGPGVVLWAVADIIMQVLIFIVLLQVKNIDTATVSLSTTVFIKISTFCILNCFKSTTGIPTMAKKENQTRQGEIC